MKKFFLVVCLAFFCSTSSYSFDIANYPLMEKPGQWYDKAKTFLIDVLKKMYVTGRGHGFAIDASGLIHTKHPLFNVTFENEAGETFNKKYRINFTNIEPAINLRCNLNAIFFVNVDPDFHLIDHEINLGWGVSAQFLPSFFISRIYNWIYDKMTDTQSNTNEKQNTDEAQNIMEWLEQVNVMTTISLISLQATYIKLKKRKGGLIILTVSPGLTGAASILYTSSSIIKGGTITPLRYENDLPTHPAQDDPYY